MQIEEPPAPDPEATNTDRGIAEPPPVRGAPPGPVGFRIQEPPTRRSRTHASRGRIQEPAPNGPDPVVEEARRSILSANGSEDREPGVNGLPAPWVKGLERYPVQIGIVGAILVLAIVLSAVYLVGQSPNTPSNSLTQGAKVAPDTTLAPSTSPDGTAATPTSPSSTVPQTSAPSSAAKPAVAAKSSSGSTPTTAAGSPGPCKSSDLSISTTTGSSSYGLGSSVTAVTKVVDDTACVFTPLPSGQYSCPATLVFVDGNGNQVYPVNGQGEQCASVSSGTLHPGSALTVTLNWAATTDGQYRAVGVWSWSGSGSPSQVTADSSAFTVG
jgi:hypothetical protein